MSLSMGFIENQIVEPQINKLRDELREEMRSEFDARDRVIQDLISKVTELTLDILALLDVNDMEEYD